MAEDFDLANPELQALDFSGLMPPSPGPSAASFQPPMGQPSRGNQWQSLMPLAAILPAILKGGGHVGAAAFLQGLQQAQQQRRQTSQQDFSNQRTLNTENRLASSQEAQEAYQRGQLVNQRQAAQNAFRQRVMAAAGNIETPEAANALLSFLGPEGETLGIPRNQVEAYVMTAATPSKLEQKAAQKYIGQLEKTYGQDWAEKFANGATFKVPGLTLPTNPATGAQRGLSVQELLAKAGTNVAGVPMKPAKADVPNTPEEQFYQQFAVEHGAKSFSQLPTKTQAEARTQWTHLDNTPKGEPRQRFSVQQVTNADGTTGLLRVNLDTGDATPVELPTGAGAGHASDTQRLSAAYSARTTASDVTAKKFEKLLTGLGPQLDVKLPNLLKSEAGQRYKQAKDEFINAALRRESGAAIQPSEYTRFDAIYFVQPGDTDATIQQKQEARQRVIDGFKVAAGNLTGTPAQPAGRAPGANPFRH